MSPLADRLYECVETACLTFENGILFRTLTEEIVAPFPPNKDPRMNHDEWWSEKFTEVVLKHYEIDVSPLRGSTFDKIVNRLKESIDGSSVMLTAENTRTVLHETYLLENLCDLGRLKDETDDVLKRLQEDYEDKVKGLYIGNEQKRPSEISYASLCE